MPDVTYTPLDESVELNAASLNDRFSGVTDAVNALQADAVADKAFNATHLPTLLLSEDHDWAHQSSDGTYAESGSFAVINDGADLSLDLGGTYSPANAGSLPHTAVGCILVKFSAVVINVGLAGTLTGPSSDKIWAGFRIQSSVNGSSWSDHAKTERWVGCRGGDYVGGGEIKQHVSVSISTYLDSSDLGSGARYLRAQVRCYDGAAGGAAEAVIADCQLAAMVLRSQRS